MIKNLKIEGPTIPPMSYTGSSNDQTAKKAEYQTIRPGEVSITVITDKDPGRINLNIDPILKQ